MLLPVPGNYNVVCVDPARKDASEVPPSSFMMPLSTGGYHVTSAPPEAKAPTLPPAEGGAAAPALDAPMEDAAAADEAAPMEE